MEAEKVLNFYNWFWFQRQIFEKEPTFSSIPSFEANPDDKNGVKALNQNQEISISDSVSVKSLISKLEEKPKTAAFKKSCERKRQKELEFEEVKGFRDLGFEFSEEDMNSKLGFVIPGLNKLGLEEEEEEEEEEESRIISRPYLSEVWEVLGLDRKREEMKALLLKNWKLPPPSLRSETDIKQNLRWWAHTVASTVI